MTLMGSGRGSLGRRGTQKRKGQVILVFSQMVNVYRLQPDLNKAHTTDEPPPPHTRHVEDVVAYSINKVDCLKIQSQ